jgi:hypothetical protein
MGTQEIVKAFSGWEIFYFIANYILAAIAIAGFWSSTRTSGKVQDSLRIIQRSLNSFSEPLIKVTKTDWMVTGGDGTNIISRNNPPKGIMVSYTNVSRVPIQILHTELKVFYGKKLFDEPVQETTHPDDGPQILAPGESTSSGTMQAELFEKYLTQTKENIFTPPHLNYELKIKFSTMDGEDFTYHARQEVMFNINQPEQLVRRFISEKMERVNA